MWFIIKFIISLTLLEPPKTPIDPCDRVKFILGAEEGTDGNTFTAHSIFTELEELHYDEHGQKLVKL